MHSFFFSKVRLAGLASLLLIFSACSHLDSTSNTQVKFQLNMARSALSELNGVMATVELKGGVEQTKTQALDLSKKSVEFTFDSIPLGAEVYAQLEIFVEEENQKKVLYSGKSESIVISEGTNILSITLKKVASLDEENGEEKSQDAEVVEDKDEKEKEEKEEENETVEEIEEKEITIEINLPEDDEINVSVKIKNAEGAESEVTASSSIEASTASSIIFTAEAGYDSYIWKLDGSIVESEANALSYKLNLAEAPFNNAEANSLIDITLLAHKEDGDLYHSFSVQVKIK